MSRKTSLYEHKEMSYWILPSSVPVGFFSLFFFGGGGGERVLRFPGLVEHSPEFAEIICSLAYCVCEKGCSCNVADDRSFKANWKRFSSTGGRDPGDNFLPTSSTRSQPFWHLIGTGKLLCFSAQSESSRPRSRVGSSTRPWKPSPPRFLPTRGWEIQCVFLNAGVSEGVEQAGENKTANFTWEWSLKICIAITGWRLHACRFSY